MFLETYNLKLSSSDNNQDWVKKTHKKLQAHNKEVENLIKSYTLKLIEGIQAKLIKNYEKINPPSFFSKLKFKKTYEDYTKNKFEQVLSRISDNNWSISGQNADIQFLVYHLDKYIKEKNSPAEQINSIFAICQKLPSIGITENEVTSILKSFGKNYFKIFESIRKIEISIGLYLVCMWLNNIYLSKKKDNTEINSLIINKKNILSKVDFIHITFLSEYTNIIPLNSFEVIEYFLNYMKSLSNLVPLFKIENIIFDDIYSSIKNKKPIDPILIGAFLRQMIEEIEKEKKGGINSRDLYDANSAVNNITNLVRTLPIK